MAEIKNIRFTNQCQEAISVLDDRDTAPLRSGESQHPLSLRRWRTAMSIREHDFTAGRSRFAAAVFAASFGLVQKAYALIVAWTNRRAAGQYLLAMDDRMLADIGVTRSDLRAAWSEPVWQDPTIRLQRMAAERRVARLAQRAMRQGPQPRPPVSAVNLRRESPSEPRPANRFEPKLVKRGEAA
jgi:uncharacterized protein YjiS (DUF1127 family)